MSKRTMIVLVLASTLVVANGGIALGKGSESVTITGPGIDSPIELMDAVSWPISCVESCPPDPMIRLMEQTGLWYGTGDLPVSLEGAVGRLGSGHVLTWINSGPPSDPIDERTIRQLLYLHAEGGPVIHTPTQVGLEGWGPDVVGWFTAPDGLMDTLAALGVPVSASQSISDVSASIDAAAALSVESQPTDRLRYLAVVGFGLVIGLVWAARRRKKIA